MLTVSAVVPGFVPAWLPLRQLAAELTLLGRSFAC